MRVNIALLPRLIAQRRATAIFGVVIIAMIWGGIGLKYIDDTRGDRRDAERTNANFAIVFEENVLRSIGEIDKALLYLRRSIETRRGTTSYHTIANTADVLSEIIVQVAIIDDQGIMRASNAGPQPAPAVDLSDREHYKVHVGTTEDRLFISKPVLGRVSHQWSVQFTRRFNDNDGKFAGVVVASLNPEHLTNFYSQIDFGSSASISLIGDDGVVRSSGGNVGGFNLGASLSATPFMSWLKAGHNQTSVYEDPKTQAETLVTFRKVRGHPLWVSVSKNMDEIFRGSWGDLQVNIAAGLVLTLVVLAAMERILRTENKAREKTMLLQLTLENMSQGIMLVTKDQEIPVINSKVSELLGLPHSGADQPPCFDDVFKHKTLAGAPSLFDTEAKTVAPARSAMDAARVTISEHLLPDNRIVEVRSGALPDGGDVLTFTDITKRREAEAYIARLASEDSSTGLPNRRIFQSALEDIYEQLRTNPEQDSFATMFLDLDRFKIVNDTLGHRVGDLLLKEVALRLRQALPASYTFARLGGDEFAIIVPAFKSLLELEVVAREIIDTVGRPFEIEGYQIRSGISIGISIGPQDGKDADELLVAADLALYTVKEEARGTFKFYQSGMSAELGARREIELKLRAAIERDELQLHYQPIINLETNAITGFEALIRWNHIELGMIPPATFIPIAEDSGLILPIGQWVLTEACRTAAQWPSAHRVAVNISPVQLLAPGLFDMITGILHETGLAPERLEIEITERTIMEDHGYTLAMLRRLKGIGVRIAMDDFGTGYSSLSNLQKFPFDKIKIDQSFIANLINGPEQLVIVQAVVSIARALGMTTTAEGVEAAYQQDFLISLGCNEAQGYLFSPAVSKDDIGAMIEQFQSRAAAA